MTLPSTRLVRMKRLLICLACFVWPLVSAAAVENQCVAPGCQKHVAVDNFGHDFDEAQEEMPDSRALQLLQLSHSLNSGTTTKTITINEMLQMDMKLAPGKAQKVGKTMNYLFVLSAGGRTGSTSLTRMVNAIPGFFIAGENGGVMNTFTEMMKPIMLRSTHVGEHVVSPSSSDTHGQMAWAHKPIVEQKVRNAIQDYITAIIGEVNAKEIHTIGFKEIRDTRSAELDLFLKVFPGARFILNSRQNIRAQVESTKSQHWIDRSTAWNDRSTEKLRNASLSLEQFQAKHPDISFLMRTEDFDLDMFNQMLTWLGVDHCRYTNVAKDSTLYLSNDHFIKCE